MTATIRALKDLGSAYFRIDWIGHVMPRNLLVAATPSVSVVVSVRHSLDEVRIEEEHVQHELLIPVAFLRFLRIGDFWHNGQRIKASDGENLSFLNLEINETTVEVKPVGMPVTVDNESRYLLPFDQYCTHRKHTGSHAARIKLNERDFLVIPCMELIRFYFGASGALLSRLFSGPIQGSKLNTSAKVNPLGLAHVKLAEGLPGVAAPTVARIALDADAANAANWIVKSGVAAAANKTRYYPAVKFPFEGNTTLKVVGRWISTPDFDVCVVDRLVSCTHPFPFQSLHYELHAGTKIQDPKKSAFHDKNPFQQKNRSKNKASDDVVLNQGTVKSTLAAAAIDVGEIDAFPDLKGKSIRRIGANPSAFSAGSTKELPLAVGPFEGNGMHRGIDVSGAAVSKNLSAPEAILEAVDILRHEHGVDVELVSLPHLASASVPPFKQVKYVGPLEQRNFPVIVGARICFLNNGQRQELILLTYESNLYKSKWVTAIFSIVSNDQMLASTRGSGLLLRLWWMARCLAGFDLDRQKYLFMTKNLISMNDAFDPQKLAQAILESI